MLCIVCVRSRCVAEFMFTAAIVRRASDLLPSCLLECRFSFQCGLLQEQKEYLLQTACWSDVHPGNVLGQPAVVKAFDLAAVPVEEIKAPIRSKFTMLVTRQGPVSGLAAFFDTAFRGSNSHPAETEVCYMICIMMV